LIKSGFNTQIYESSLFLSEEEIKKNGLDKNGGEIFYCQKP